jgi:ferritin-like metal-binding protein YciE
MNQEQVIELILQSLEHERGGIQVYETAVQCVQNDDLRKEFKKYLEETRNHERVLIELCTALEIDPEAPTPGREVVRMMGKSLVEAMKKAKSAGKPEAAQLIACECVVLAETKDHLNWELIGQLAQNGRGDGVEALQAAYDEVEDQEDEHLYHSKGWCRELWIQALGMKAELPPPEERKHVKTAIGAARAEQARKSN